MAINARQVISELLQFIRSGIITKADNNLISDCDVVTRMRPLAAQGLCCEAARFTCLPVLYAFLFSGVYLLPATRARLPACEPYCHAILHAMHKRTSRVARAVFALKFLYP